MSRVRLAVSLAGSHGSLLEGVSGGTLMENLDRPIVKGEDDMA